MDQKISTESSNKTSNLVEVQDLKKYFTVKRGFFGRSKQVLKAVDGVSLSIAKGETVGLVGESGCGKSTLGRTILRLYEPSSGAVRFDGQDICSLNSLQMRAQRKNMQIIFQDPFASLDPRMTVGALVGEALAIHDLEKEGNQRQEKIKELLSLVGLRPEAIRRYPHEFSGGQRQRIGIARALAVKPQFIVCDEPISALDVSIQAQIVNLLQDLQEKFSLSYLFIAHDLPIVRYISTQTAVMYLGDIVEFGPTALVHADPKHPYTRALLSSVPSADPAKKGKRIILKGEIPSPLNPPRGCKFHTRCPEVFELCHHVVPQMVTIGAGRRVSCHLYPSCPK